MTSRPTRRGIVAVAPAAQRMPLDAEARSRLRRLAWPLPTGWVLISTALIGATTAVQLTPTLGWVYVDWPAISALPIAGMAVTGPVAATAACWMSSALWDPRNPVGSSVAVRAGPATLAAHARVLGSWWVAALTAAGAPFLAVGVGRGTAHSPAVLPLLAAAAALLFFTALGYATGALLPRRGAPLAAAGIALVIVFGSELTPTTYSNPAQVLLPVVGSDARIGQVAVAFTWAVKTVVLAAAAAALLWLPAKWPRSPGSKQRAFVTAGLPLVAVLLVAAALPAARLLLYVRHEDVTATCTSAEQVQVCTEQGQQSALPAVAAALVAATDVVGGPPEQLRRVVDQVLDPQRLARPLGTPLPPPRLGTSDPTVWVTLLPGGEVEPQVIGAVVEWLSGIDACSTLDSAGQLVTLPGLPRALDLADRIATLIEQNSTDSALSAWYQRAQAGVLSCDAPQLPPTEAGFAPGRGSGG